MVAQKAEMRDLMIAVKNGVTDDALIRNYGATPAQIEWAKNPPPMRDDPNDRYTITVVNVRHTTFHATAQTEATARDIAQRVANWSAFRRKAVIVTDRAGIVEDKIDLFGNPYSKITYPVIYRVA